MNEQALSTKFNDAARDYQREVDAAKANDREKPRRVKKGEDIHLFGGAFVPLGFGKLPRSDLMYWLKEFCTPDNPFECTKRMTLWWQSAERGEWTHCFRGFAITAGKIPPVQWYNHLPGRAERFFTWCAYPKKEFLKNLMKQKHWKKDTGQWDIQHIDFYAVSRIIVADNADASALWWQWQHEKAYRWSFMGFECTCKEYWTPEGLQHPTSTSSYCVVPIHC